MILIQHATLGGFNRVRTGGHRNAFKINGKKGVWAQSGMCDVQLHAALSPEYNVHQRAYVQEVTFHKHVPHNVYVDIRVRHSPACREAVHPCGIANGLVKGTNKCDQSNSSKCRND